MRGKSWSRRASARMRTLLLIAPLTLLANCGATGAVATDCAAWRPILVADEDQITDPTARDILAHNLTGRRLCGW